MKYLKFFILGLLLIFFINCSKKTEHLGKGNIFIDSIIKKIYTLQDKRDAEKIYHYLKDKNAFYRRYAALSLGSVQETKSIPFLIPLLDDNDMKVRAAASFSLGQIGDKRAEKPLKSAFEGEKETAVRNFMLEALGKCGTENGLKFLVELTGNGRNVPYSEGITMGFYRYLLRKIYSERSVKKVIGFLDQRFPPQTRFYAANVLSRIKGFDLSPYSKILIKSFKREKDIFIKMNIVLSLGKTKGQESIKIVKSIMDSNEDYRIKVNALRALKNFRLSEFKNMILKAVNGKDHNVSLVATQMLLSQKHILSAYESLKLAQSISDRRIRSLFFSIALKLTEDKRAVSKSIIDLYKKSSDKIEKGLLLRSLSSYIGNFRFISEEIFKNTEKFVSTNGMTSIAEIINRWSHGDRSENGRLVSEDNIIAVLKKGISSGDSSLMGISSSVLRDPKLNVKNKLKDLGFLHKALDRCKLPEDIEPYIELKKALNFFEGKNKDVQYGKLKTRPINWENVKNISTGARVMVRTNRGDITILLLVNASPGSVSNFIDLIKKNFYKNSIFHRVVPNFVIQDGCPRGDGWGGPGYSIRSEFFPVYYSEGSVGMASAGKDTEGSQWFITHSPTPHLDGRYTIFGRVIKGMDIVHKIRLGDKIEEFKLIEN